MLSQAEKTLTKAPVQKLPDAQRLINTGSAVECSIRLLTPGWGGGGGREEKDKQAAVGLNPQENTGLLEVQLCGVFLQ